MTGILPLTWAVLSDLHHHKTVFTKSQKARQKFIFCRHSYWHLNALHRKTSDSATVGDFRHKWPHMLKEHARPVCLHGLVLPPFNDTRSMQGEANLCLYLACSFDVRMWMEPVQSPLLQILLNPWNELPKAVQRDYSIGLLLPLSSSWNPVCII